jgi:hypothetical protein
MRVPDHFLKCVGFVAELVSSDADGDTYDHQATGFFVNIRSDRQGSSYYLFVTAKHVAEDLKDKEIAFIVNKKDGGVTSLTMASQSWFLHPTDKSVDVAVLPFNMTPDLDLVSIPLDRFLTPALMLERGIGIGDEVFVPGLFTYATGVKRNMPILRHGNLAMIPDEPIQVDDGFAEVYLMEARSIGGMSGSPVFVRRTVSSQTYLADGSETHMLGLSEVSLLGLAHGHWDIKESEINNPSFIQDRQRGVNLGIGVVVPAHKIIEVIEHPDLVKLRENNEARIRSMISPGLDRIVIS